MLGPFSQIRNQIWFVYIITPCISRCCNSFDIVCVCVCMSRIHSWTLLRDIWTWNLELRSSGRISRSSLKVKIIGQSSMLNVFFSMEMWCLLELKHLFTDMTMLMEERSISRIGVVRKRVCILSEEQSPPGYICHSQFCHGIDDKKFDSY